MKKINTNLFPVYVLILSSLYSCSTPKMGFFNNSNPAYTLNDHKNLTKQEAAIGSIDHSSNSEGSQVAIQNPISEKIAPKETKKAKMNEITISAPVVKLNKEEKKEIIRYIKEGSSKSSNHATGLSKGVLVILAILLPPLAVALVDGITAPFWLSLVLTIIFYFPGLIYALYRIFKNQ